MPATLAPALIPPRAIPIWTDGVNLYTCVSGPSGDVYLRFPRTSAGLSAALGLITERAYDLSAGAGQPSGSGHNPSTKDLAKMKLRALGVPI